MLRNRTVFCPPTWDAEPLAVGILGKIVSEGNRQIASDTLESLAQETIRKRPA